MIETDNYCWDATSFFERLTATNKHAVNNGYRFFRTSSLEGFHDALGSMNTTKAMVAVSDTSDGGTSLSNSPHTRRVKTVFMAMRHAVDDMKAREKVMANMRELFRQFMTVLILEKTKLEQNQIYIDDHISFTEMDRYFFTGAACAFFQIAVDTYTDLVFNPDDWLNYE